MNILFLENEGSWREQYLLKLNDGTTHLVETFTDTQLKDPVEKIAELIVADFIFVDLIIINVNIIAGENDRSACCGVKLIKLLRLHGLQQRCILYSFFSREQLMVLSPENLIVFSEGLTYIRLPYDFKQIDLGALSKKMAPTNLTAYLKAESHLPDDRHFFANWWGVLQLWKVHRALNSLGKKAILQIEKEMFVSAQHMTNYQGLLAQYLYGNEVQKLTPTIIEQQRELHQTYRDFTVYDTSFSQLEEQRIELEAEIKRISEKLEIIKDNDKWQKYEIDYFLQVGQLEKNAQQICDQQFDINPQIDTKKKLDELVSIIEEEKSRLLSNHKVLISNISKKAEHSKALTLTNNTTEIISFAEKLRTESPRILYIDDQADEGWSTIFQHLIYGKVDPENFKVLDPKNYEKDSLILTCFKNANDFDPDLIILDLRLYGEKGTISDYNNLSGIKVLKELKHGNDNFNPINCPVLVVTASNKSLAINAVMTSGADGYWIKEGLDNHFSLEETIFNYWDFIGKAFALCCSDEFKFLRKMRSGTQLLKNQQTLWLESDRRFNQVFTPGSKLNTISKESVLEIFNEGLDFLASYLQNKLMKNLPPNFEQYLPSLIAIKLFKAIELIHEETGPYNHSSTLNLRVLKHHENEIIYRLLEVLNLRNQSVHNMDLTLPELELFYEYIIGYIAKRTFNGREYLAMLNIPFSDKDIHHSIIKKITKYCFYLDKDLTVIDCPADIKCDVLSALSRKTLKLEDIVTFQYFKKNNDHIAKNITVKPNPIYVLR